MTVTGTGDTQPPKLTGTTIAPASVDTAAAPRDVAVRAQLTDDLSGVRDVTLRLTSPSGNRQVSASAARTGGSTQNGPWDGTLTLPRYAEQGDWQLSIHAQDAAGNTLFVSPAELVSAGRDHEVHQTGAGDTHAPTATAVTIDPTSIDTYGAARSVTVDVDAADDLSGTSALTVTARGPHGQQVSSPATRQSGTTAVGSWRATLTVPAYSDQGTWKVTLQLSDIAGNDRTVSAADLATAGQPYSFEQTGVADITAPNAAAVTVSPRVIDTFPAPRDVHVVVRATDDLSGTASVVVRFTSPHGQVVAGSTTLDAGESPLDGTWSTTVTFPRFSEQGAWSLRLDLVDVRGNHRTVTPELAVNVNPPEIDCADAPLGWSATNVDIACTATDDESALADPGDAEFTLSTHVAVGEETDSAQTDSHEVCDIAGACATAGPIGPIKVDRKPPSVVLTAPADGQQVVRGTPLIASFSCSDGGSGVAACGGTRPSGDALDTSTAGTFAFSVTGTDTAGNSYARSVHYTVTEPASLGFAAEVAADNPGWWFRLGESSGSTMTAAAGGKTGNYQNGVVVGQPDPLSGDPNTAARFNGTAAYGYVNGIAAPTQAYTMEIWMKADAALKDGSLMDHGGAGALYIKTDRFCFRQTSTHVCWTQPPSTGVWYHVVGTWDKVSKTARLYVNGVERASGQAATAPSGSGTFYVGYGQSAPWFKGYLDEAVYYPSSLSATRVGVHYHAGCGC